MSCIRAEVPFDDRKSLAIEKLLERCRDGDSLAFAQLFDEFWDQALTIASQITSIEDCEDIAAEAFMRIWNLFCRGGGPTQDFSSYLRATIRNVANSWIVRNRERMRIDYRIEAKLLANGFGDGTMFVDSLIDRQLIVHAFTSLSECWKQILWLTEVEGYSAMEVGALLGVLPNTAAARRLRAQRALSQAWIQMHIKQSCIDSDCHWVRDRLGRYVCRLLVAGQTQRIATHLANCRDCLNVAKQAAKLGVSLRINTRYS